MYLRFGIIHLLFWGLMALQVAAQQPYFKHYTKEDGLPSAMVYQVIQDHNGYIWFGTESGVSRFDGTRFQNFDTKDGLVDNDIIRLKEDSQHRIWFFGVTPYPSFFQNGEIIHPEHPKGAFLKQMRVPFFFYDLVEDKKGNTYFTDDMLNVFCVDRANSVRHYEMTKLIPGQVVGRYLTPFQMPNDDVVLVSANQMFNFTRQKTHHFLDDTIQNGHRPCQLADGSIIGFPLPYCVWIDPEGNAKLIEVPKGIQALGINDVVASGKKDSLWLATTHGALLVRVVNRDSTSPRIEILETQFPDHRITDVLEDREGNTWFTSNSGVFMIPSRKMKMYTYPKGLQSAMVNSLYADGDDIWIGQEEHRYARLSGDSLQYFQLHSNSRYTGLRVNDFLRKKDGSFLVGGDGGLKYESENESIFAVLTCKGLLELQGGGIAIVGAGTIYLLTVDDIRKCALNKDHLKSEKNGPNRYELGVRVRDAIQVSPEKILINSLDGILEFDSRASSTRTVLLEGNTVNRIARANSGAIWFATHSRGAGYYIPGKDTVYITSDDGLPGGGCMGLFIDGEDNAWIGTSQGLAKVVVKDYNTGEFQVINYPEETGLFNFDIRDLIILNNEIWLATTSGLVRSSLDILTQPRSNVPIFIERYSYGGNYYFFWNNKMEKPSQVQYSDNTISFDFAAIDFRNPIGLRYKYWLEGLDTSRTLTSSNHLDFANLAPGVYTFHVAPALPDGGVTGREATFTFEVLAPVWRKLWFQMLSLVLLIVFSVSVTVLITRRIRLRERRRAQLQSRLAEAEQSALRARMNPHFIFNCLNSIQRFYLTQRPEIANEYLADFAKLIRTIFDHSARTAIPLEDEIEAIRLYVSLEKLRLGDRFSTVIEVDPSIDVVNTLIPPLILQPFVENAIWHGLSAIEKDGKLIVAFRPAPRGLLCTIEDNGIGRDKAAELKKGSRATHKSRGAALTSERIELLNNSLEEPFRLNITDLKKLDGTPAGTRVDLFVPFTFNEPRS